MEKISFRNKRTNAIISVEGKVKELTNLYKVLKVPVDYKSIKDSRIEYVEYSTQDVKNLKGYRFIFECDLTKDLKDLFIKYYGCLAVFLDDCQHYDDYEINSATKHLEKQLKDCMSKSIDSTGLNTRLVYKDITFSDENTRTNWELLDEQLNVV